MNTQKPHKGKISHWVWLPLSERALKSLNPDERGLGIRAAGQSDGHERFSGESMITSLVVSAVTSPDGRTIEIETLNSRYTLVQTSLPASACLDTLPTNKLGQVVIRGDLCRVEG